MVMPSSTMSLNSGRTCSAVIRPLPFFARSMPRLMALTDSLDPSVGNSMCLNMGPPGESGTVRRGIALSVRLAGAMRRERQRHHLDAFFLQGLDVVARGGSANAALGRLAIVDLARLFGERRADVLGVLDDVLDELRQHLAPHVGVLLGGDDGGADARRALLRARLDVSGVGQPRDIRVAAQRAGDELAIDLALEILARGEPALEAMTVLATQVEDDHAVTALSVQKSCHNWWCPGPDSNRHGLAARGF